MLSSLFAADYTYTYTTTDPTSTKLAFMSLLIIWLVVLFFSIVLIIVPLWRIYTKAGKPGWAAIIPVYSNWVLFEIVGFPGWWAILFLVPIVDIFPAIMAIVAYFKLAKLFGKSDLFGVMTVLFPWVCLPILGFGKATFQGSGGNAQPAGTTPAGGYTPPQSPATPIAPTAPGQSGPTVPQTPAPTDVVSPDNGQQTPPPPVNPTPPQPPAPLVQ